jgi:hypothetical protein
MDGQVKPWRIDPQTGGSLKPGDVVGRDAVILWALDQIRRGNNLLVTDPRRMGKTMMLERLSNEPGDGLMAVMLSYEGVTSVDEFFKKTIWALSHHTGVWRKVKKTLGPIVEVEASSRVVSVKAAFDDRPRIDLLGNALEAVEARLDQGERLIVVMDEVPIAIRNIAKHEGPKMADQLLQRLRSLREDSNQLSWIISGSIGFHHVLRDAETTEGVINDLESLPLGPLDRSGAELLARCLMIGIDREVDEGAVAEMVEVTGGIPFLLHHLALVLQPADGFVTQQDVQEGWDGFIENRDLSKAMTHLLTRMKEYPADLRNAAHAVLDQVATGPDQVQVDNLPESAELEPGQANVLLDLLVDDHYLVERDGAFAWRYDVLRRIWVTRRRLGGRR